MKKIISRLSSLPRINASRRRLAPSAMVLATLSVTAFAPAMAASALDDGMTAYRHGEFEKSASIFAPLAENGDATAQYLLSCQMINGAGMTANEADGWDMMQKAALNLQADASIIMARKLEASRAPKDHIRALYQQSADQGETQAMLWLALDALDQGKADDAKALLEKAWELGDPRAATLLANRFTKTDSGRYQYLRAAAQRGEMRAAAYLAEEARSVEDTAEAVGWCAVATGLPGHNEHVDWKSIGDAVEKNCAQFDKDLDPTARAANRERVDQFLASFFENYKPWTPWQACSVK
ncbi:MULTISPECIES: sel1 repeat family protein [Thalassospira]|uniref:Sel1 repeat family protein n=1 Tax=Thalassospira aquimaris TaxID=3037796 RepID=A0ABT6G867_9PROT|nr:MULTISPECIES: sel1 repeat family protein [Thalassospira]MDG4717959.1 sel1 repeat family protein [Thalassospira sp. FZY0004]